MRYKKGLELVLFGLTVAFLGKNDESYLNNNGRFFFSTLRFRWGYMYIAA
tara:strand:- start:295 stop:444 length:150 start_codon:yes stop_codon:yes gene_type:complete